MSLWNTLKQHAGAQFLELIEWLDSSKDTVVWRFPVFNQAITDKSKVVVREGQAAVFQSEGRLSDVFGPGTYTLDTKNTPILSFFTSIAYSLNYPYKGDVYFVSTRQFTDNGWGTATPIMMRDAEFGPVRIRAYGIYSFRVTDPAAFIRQIVGTDGLFTTDEITGQLKRKLVSALADTVGQAKIPVLDLAANYMDLADKLRERMNPLFSEGMGITLTDFTIQNISLPEEVEKALDTRTKMGVLGNLDAYAKLQMTDASADAMRKAAGNPGMGGMPMAMGVGFGLGNQVGATMGQAMAGPGQFNPHTGMQGPPPPMPPPLPAAAQYHYSGPTGQAQLSLADVVARVSGDAGGAHMVWQAGWPGWKAAKEVPEIAAQLPPPPVAPPPLPGAARYHYNGPGGGGEKSAAEVVAAVRANPDAAHHVWQPGWAGWKPVAEVAELAPQLRAGPPPPP
jgi:membrane protease subunit (stomatin/prohibitin family)